MEVEQVKLSQVSKLMFLTKEITMDEKIAFFHSNIQIKIKKTTTITVIKRESKYSPCQRVIPV